MKKTVVTVLVVVLLALGLLVSCVGGIVKGSGNLATEGFNFSDFTHVDVGSAFEVEIAQSDSYSVSVITDDNLLDYVLVSKQGTTLKIRLKSASYISTTARAEITMPQLHDLDLSEATQGTVSGFSSGGNIDIKVSGASSLDLIDMSVGDVKLNISGASRVNGDIKAIDVNFDISEASTVQLQGSANDIDVDTSGASHMELATFPVNNADIKFSGASSGTVNLDGRLNADLSGASNLKYIGEPTIEDINISSASTVSKG
ncbi:GIN domain-containing protein [Chloroflexota bacterium]